jgi:hypothetical protein
MTDLYGNVQYTNPTTDTNAAGPDTSGWYIPGVAGASGGSGFINDYTPAPAYSGNAQYYSVGGVDQVGTPNDVTGGTMYTPEYGAPGTYPPQYGGGLTTMPVPQQPSSNNLIAVIPQQQSQPQPMAPISMPNALPFAPVSMPSAQNLGTGGAPQTLTPLPQGPGAVGGAPRISMPGGSGGGSGPTTGPTGATPPGLPASPYTPIMQLPQGSAPGAAQGQPSGGAPQAFSPVPTSPPQGASPQGFGAAPAAPGAPPQPALGGSPLLKGGVSAGPGAGPGPYTGGSPSGGGGPSGPYIGNTPPTSAPGGPVAQGGVGPQGQPLLASNQTGPGQGQPPPGSTLQPPPPAIPLNQLAAGAQQLAKQAAQNSQDLRNVAGLKAMSAARAKAQEPAPQDSGNYFQKIDTDMNDIATQAKAAFALPRIDALKQRKAIAEMLDHARPDLEGAIRKNLTGATHDVDLAEARKHAEDVVTASEDLHKKSWQGRMAEKLKNIPAMTPLTPIAALEASDPNIRHEAEVNKQFNYQVGLQGEQLKRRNELNTMLTGYKKQLEDGENTSIKTLSDTILAGHTAAAAAQNAYLSSRQKELDENKQLDDEQKMVFDSKLAQKQLEVNAGIQQAMINLAAGNQDLKNQLGDLKVQQDAGKLALEKAKQDLATFMGNSSLLTQAFKSWAESETAWAKSKQAGGKQPEPQLSDFVKLAMGNIDKQKEQQSNIKPVVNNAR